MAQKTKTKTRYWIHVKCALCKVEMGELRCTKEFDRRIAYSVCPMCIARKYKGRKHACFISIPVGVEEEKVKPKPKSKKGKKK